MRWNCRTKAQTAPLRKPIISKQMCFFNNIWDNGLGQRFFPCCRENSGKEENRGTDYNRYWSGIPLLFALIPLATSDKKERIVCVLLGVCRKRIRKVHALEPS